MLRLLSRFAGVFGERLLSLGFPISVRELAPGDTITLGDAVQLGCTKVPHTEESMAYSVEARGRRIVYTGDTAADDALGLWARGCDVLLTECSLPDAMAIPTHLTPSPLPPTSPFREDTDHAASPRSLLLPTRPDR